MSRLLFNWKGNGYHFQLYLTCLPDPLAGNVHKLTSALKAKIVLTVRYILAPAPQLQLEKIINHLLQHHLKFTSLRGPSHGIV